MLFAKILSAMFHCIWNSPDPVPDVSLSVERVVDHGAVFGVSPLRRISPDGNTRGMASDR